jgi:hypothetical protein
MTSSIVVSLGKKKIYIFVHCSFTAHKGQTGEIRHADACLALLKQAHGQSGV